MAWSPLTVYYTLYLLFTLLGNIVSPQFVRRRLLWVLGGWCSVSVWPRLLRASAFPPSLCLALHCAACVIECHVLPASFTNFFPPPPTTLPLSLQFCFHLLDLVFRMEALWSIVVAILTVSKQLALTALLVVVIVYIYTIVAFNYFRDMLVLENRFGNVRLPRVVPTHGMVWVLACYYLVMCWSPWLSLLVSQPQP